MEMPEYRPSPLVVDLAKTSPFDVYELSMYELSVESALKERVGVVDGDLTEDFVRVGIKIAVAENRALGVEHIKGLQMGSIGEKPKSARQAFRELQDAWHNLLVELIYSLRFDALLDWPTAKRYKLRRRLPEDEE